MPNVNTINKYAFNKCSALTKITIPSSVISIKDPDIDYIEDGAFSECTALTNIIIQNKFIVEYQFSGCSKLTTITIPSSVTSIGYYAFKGCSNLTNIIFTGALPTITTLEISNINIFTEEEKGNKMIINYYSAYNKEFTEYFTNFNHFSLNILDKPTSTSTKSSLLMKIIMIIIGISILSGGILLYMFYIKKS